MVLAPYGLLQSLLRDRDLMSTLAEVAECCDRAHHSGWSSSQTFRPEGISAARELERLAQHARWFACDAGGDGAPGSRTRAHGFRSEFTERRGGNCQVHRFALSFRTLSVPQMARRLRKRDSR